jgi:ADP-ribose pyrophosphatase YjhB (NUDIX family)
VLITRRIAGWDTGHWRIPSGFPLAHERLSDAAVREVGEETQIRASCDGLLAVRHLIYDWRGKIRNEVHPVFKMKWIAGEPTPDRTEIDASEFVTLATFKEREKLSSVYVEMIEKALSGQKCLEEADVSLKRPDIHLNVAYL